MVTLSPAAELDEADAATIWSAWVAKAAVREPITSRVGRAEGVPQRDDLPGVPAGREYRLPRKAIWGLLLAHRTLDLDPPPGNGTGRVSVLAGFYRTAVIDTVLESSPAGVPAPAPGPAGVPNTRLTHLQFEALPTAARTSPNRSDIALVGTLGLLGLRIFEACAPGRRRPARGARSPRPPGRQWWTMTAKGHQAFAAVGWGGQLIEVVPSLRLVVAASTVGDPQYPLDTSYLLDLVTDQIIPHLA